jgi:hypothetical protein
VEPTQDIRAGEPDAQIGKLQADKSAAARAGGIKTRYAVVTAPPELLI